MEPQTQIPSMTGSSLRLVRNTADLISIFEESQQPRTNWRIGTETEKFGVVGSPPEAIPYTGSVSVLSVMSKLATRFGWAPESEMAGGLPIALKRGLASISLEPGGQLELSGAPLPDIHAICAEMEHHVRELELVSIPLGIQWLSVGFHPFARLDQLPWVPKSRYGIMREYLPARGSGALDMMQRTATVQVNLDYEDERDALRKTKIFLRLAPIVHAMTAHAPISESHLSGYQSLRGDVWLRMDPARSGLIESLWTSPHPRYETYVEWALDAGMFLFKRAGKVVANTGQTFRSFMQDGYEGHRATFDDWVLHLNTLFPEIRLKKTLEVRSCDAQPMDTLLAVPALWTAIGYDDTALERAARLTHSLTYEEMHNARPDLVRLGLQAMLAGRPIRDWAEEILVIANEGLSRRARFNANGFDETRYLAPLIRLVQSGHTPASRLKRKLERSPTFDPQTVMEETRMIPQFYA
jgi:glutamate--cysteine ligase